MLQNELVEAQLSDNHWNIPEEERNIDWNINTKME